MNNRRTGINDVTIKDSPISTENTNGNVMFSDQISPRKITQWSIRSVFPLQKQVTLIIEGILLPEGSPWKSSPIEKIVNLRFVHTVSHSVYELEGPMNIEQTLRNGFSFLFAEYVQNGFPENWQFVLRSRIESGVSEETQLLKQKVQEIQQHKENKKASVQSISTPPTASAAPPMIQTSAHLPEQIKSAKIYPNTSKCQIKKLAGKGTLKRREQMRELYEEYNESMANAVQPWSDSLFDRIPSNLNKDSFTNMQVPKIGTSHRKNSLEFSLSLSNDDDLHFEPFQLKELDRIIVDEKRVAKRNSKKQSVAKLPVLKKQSIYITQEDKRSRVRAMINPNGETTFDIVDKNKDILEFSDVENSDESDC